MNSFFSSFFGEIVFYTIIPLPNFIPVDYYKIARWLGWVGMIIGGVLGGLDWLVTYVNFPPFTKATIIVGCWILITGGLHLDGVMDSADGLAVQNPEKRLQVMRDSYTGAFGVMAGIIVILLKIASLSEISQFRWYALILATTWGRWGQLMAISLYPYLHKEGKGVFLKQNLAIPMDLIGANLFIIPLVLLQYFFLPQPLWLITVTHISCAVIALSVAWWFKFQFQGHTGDNYGATVEWSEAIILTFCTVIFK